MNPYNRTPVQYEDAPARTPAAPERFRDWVLSEVDCAATVHFALSALNAESVLRDALTSELGRTLPPLMVVDWHQKDSARAVLRREVKRALRRECPEAQDQQGMADAVVDALSAAVGGPGATDRALQAEEVNSLQLLVHVPARYRTALKTVSPDRLGAALVTLLESGALRDAPTS